MISLRGRFTGTSLLVVAGAIALGVVIGVLVVRWRAGPWTLRGTGYSAEGAITVEAGGWSYGIPKDVAWTDESGAFHDGDRPACLPAGATVTVTFQAVAADDIGMRPVIWVDCRGAEVELTSGSAP